MTRPKIDDEKRQRTAQACDSCKKKKQKCDGLQPCITCSKRGLSCTYLTAHHGITAGYDTPEPKRQKTGSDGEGSLRGNVATPSSLKDEQYHKDHNGTASRSHPNRNSNLMPPSSVDQADGARNHRAPSSEGEEEADNHTMTRMLVDSTGRLLYVGDTATISFLQLLRTMIESTVGPSTFTTDPRRHRLTENTMTRPPRSQMTHLLPDKETAYVLVDAFFINANLVQVFDEGEFYETLDKCYSSPLFVDPSWLCLLNLVLAIGLVLATPPAGSPKSVIVQNLRSAYKCDIFYLNAKHLDDPVVGFEDADFWSVQALLLMALFMLCRSKRNAAYAYLGKVSDPFILRFTESCGGMAARSAYSLGLHREETLIIFPPSEQQVRRQVWRSLFVMDRFLAVSLGRPPAIHEGDCSGDALNPPPASPHPTPTDIKFYHSGLEAGVRGCHILSIIIKDVYSKRKVSTKIAQDIAERCKIWPKTLPPSLHWRQASPSNPRQGILILHVNMLYCHAIILFTRPFFLYLLSAEMQRKYMESNHDPEPRRGKTEKFSEACIIAALHTISLIQTACEGGYLPMQNPFVIYCLFSAALVVLSGRLTSRSTHEASAQAIENASSIFSYCGKLDAQAARMLQIFTSLREVVLKEEQQSQGSQQPMLSTMPLPSANPGSFPQQVSPFIQQLATPEPSSQLLTQHVPQEQHSRPTTTPSTNPMMSVTPSFSLPTTLSSTPASSHPNPSPLPPPHSYQNPPAPRMPLMHTDSFSALLDLDNAKNPLYSLTTDSNASSDDSSGMDNEIDFAALWPWPGNASANGFVSPGVGQGCMSLKDLGVQGVSDSPVPLFGIVNDE